MAIFLQNAALVDINPIAVDVGNLRIDAGRIVDRGPGLKAEPGDDVFDCRGAVVLPGMVNGHTHLYSALAIGMPPPQRTPRSFQEILELVWWRLDRALDLEAIEVSARVGALAAVRCGTTTLIDHHASPNAITGALDSVERGMSDVGVRGVLCYETTDRHGVAGRSAGIEENRRYLERCRERAAHQFAGLVGAHASFTLEDDALSALAELSKTHATGVHIHVAEDPCDEADAIKRGAATLIERLERTGITNGSAIFAHCTHLDATARTRLRDTSVNIAHNARSNMNNAVGYADPRSFTNAVMLGTDGIGGDMFAEARAAWLISQHAGGGHSPNDIVAMLAHAADRASAALGVTLGQLRQGAAADLIVTDYHPPTPLTADNVAGHLLFGLDASHVAQVMADGRWVVRDHVPTLVSAEEVHQASAPVAARLWQRMADLM